MIYERMHSCLDALGVTDHNLKNIHILWGLIWELFPEHSMITDLRVRVTSLQDALKIQQNRTDQIRESVKQYLDGDIGKKRLQRAFDKTDYSGGYDE